MAASYSRSLNGRLTWFGEMLATDFGHGGRRQRPLPAPVLVARHGAGSERERLRRLALRQGVIRVGQRRARRAVPHRGETTDSSCSSSPDPPTQRHGGGQRLASRRSRLGCRYITRMADPWRLLWVRSGLLQANSEYVVAVENVVYYAKSSYYLSTAKISGDLTAMQARHPPSLTKAAAPAAVRRVRGGFASHGQPVLCLFINLR